MTTHPSPTLPELLAWLREAPPADRARLAGLLVDIRTVMEVAAVRREAVYELTRTMTRAQAAALLGVTTAAIGKAVTEHRATQISGPPSEEIVYVAPPIA